MHDGCVCSGIIEAAYSYDRGRATLRIEHLPTGQVVTTAQRRGEALTVTKARALGILRGKLATSGHT